MSRKLFEADEEGTMAIRIVTDSACDLPQDVCDELDIEVVPLTIRFGDREYIDRKELSTEAFWKQMETSSVLPETAAPSVGAFEETFRRLADGGADGIACINLSAQLSATMQSAQLAAKALDGECPVEIIDSCSASMGIGNLVLHAARRARDGADLQTAVREVEDRRDRQRVLATLDTLEYLKKGGRIGGARALAGSMLSIKPVISVTDGVVQEAGKVRTRGKALQFIVDRIPHGKVEMISVLHAGAPDLDAFLSLVQPMVPDAEVVVGMIGPVVGVHTGPRVIGVAWIERAG
jgi:fatty acid kinase fatty acid binding subunit